MSNEIQMALGCCRFALDRLDTREHVLCGNVYELLEYYSEDELHVLSDAKNSATCPITRAFMFAANNAYPKKKPGEVVHLLLRSFHGGGDVEQAKSFLTHVINELQRS
ncbi:MAG: hypothetical protein KBD24_01780 [Candidatus Pacebacteria bacterium]|nr:hypothetical protein [Candidatus Paceibacterota bacterium]